MDRRNCTRHWPSCQLQTTQQSKPAGLLVPLHVPPLAWHTLTTDYITGLPLTANGHTAIAVFVDKLIRHVYAVPCTDQSDAMDWANMYVHNIVQHEGLSFSVSFNVISDRGLLSLATSAKPWLNALVLGGVSQLHATLDSWPDRKKQWNS